MNTNLKRMEEHAYHVVYKMWISSPKGKRFHFPLERCIPIRGLHRFCMGWGERLEGRGQRLRLSVRERDWQTDRRTETDRHKEREADRQEQWEGPRVKDRDKDRDSDANHNKVLCQLVHCIIHVVDVSSVYQYSLGLYTRLPHILKKEKRLNETENRMYKHSLSPMKENRDCCEWKRGSNSFNFAFD